MGTLIESVTKLPDASRVPKEVSDLAGAAVADLLVYDFPKQSLTDDCEALVNSSETLEDSPKVVASVVFGREPPPSVDGLPKKLLILDVNGFLIDTCFKYDKSRPKNRDPDGTVNHFLIYARPHCDEFVKFCLDNFVVGVWSSARRHNVEGLIRYIFKESASQLAFIWGQDQCTDTGLRHPENRDKPIFLKELKKVWETPPFKGVYGPNNTLLIDDSAYKALRNPPYTGIFPRTYRAGEGSEEDYLAPDGPIRCFLQGIHLAPDVRKYVKEHPFGQAAISVGADHSIEISGAIDEKVREQTRKSYEDFVARKKASQSTSTPEKGNEEEQRLEKAVCKPFPEGPTDLERAHVPFSGWPVVNGGSLAFAQPTANGWDGAERGWSDDEGPPGMNGWDRVAGNGRQRSRSPVGVGNGLRGRHVAEKWGQQEPVRHHGRSDSRAEANGWPRQSTGWESGVDDRAESHQFADRCTGGTDGWSQREAGWPGEERPFAGPGSNGRPDLRQERSLMERQWNQGAEQPFSRRAPSFAGRFREHPDGYGHLPPLVNGAHARDWDGAAGFSRRPDGLPEAPWGGSWEPWQGPLQSVDDGLHYEHMRGPSLSRAPSGREYRGTGLIDGRPPGTVPLPSFRNYRQVTDPGFRRWAGEQFPPDMRHETRWDRS